jgi:hypothetical protein
MKKEVHSNVQCRRSEAGKAEGRAVFGPLIPALAEFRSRAVFGALPFVPASPIKALRQDGNDDEGFRFLVPV